MALQHTCIQAPGATHSTNKPTQLMDLDDACLLLVFKHLMPLPDLFCCAQTCWRFHRLTSDKRMWLVVSPSYIHPEDTPSGRAGVIYSNLKAAVAASRPGDTIWLAPGMPHEAADINIPHPLHILGGGLNPDQTLISAPPGADCALSFSASCKIAMLALRTTLCPCLVHRKGLLTVEQCKLTADPKGLLHLVSPVVTLAASSSSNSNGSSRALSAAALAESSLQLAANAWELTCKSNSSNGGNRSLSMLKQSGALSVGAGRLAVVECCLQGGSTAVRCGGTGRLRDVRVIYESRAALFWLEVDSSDPGGASSGWYGQQQQQQQQLDVLLRYSQLHEQHELMRSTAAAVESQQQVQCQLDVVRLSKAKDWQHSRVLRSTATTTQGDEPPQQQQQCCPTGSVPLTGLDRIQAVLGKRVNPSMLAAHLGARKKQVQVQTDQQ